MTDLTQTRIVLQLQAEGRKPADDVEHPVDDRIWFEQETDEVEVARTVVSLSRPLWEDMGQPAEVTITIEPGDRLN